MKTIAEIASPAELQVITGHYGLHIEQVYELAEVLEFEGETEIRLKDGTVVTIYGNAIEPLVEFP